MNTSTISKLSKYGKYGTALNIGLDVASAGLDVVTGRKTKGQAAVKVIKGAAVALGSAGVGALFSGAVVSFGAAAAAGVVLSKVLKK